MNTPASTAALAVKNEAFNQWFVKSGGAFHPLNAHALTEQQCLENWQLSESEFLAKAHYFSTPRKQMTKQEVVKHVLPVRRFQQQKIAKFFLAYNAGIPPQSGESSALYNRHFSEKSKAA